MEPTNYQIFQLTTQKEIKFLKNQNKVFLIILLSLACLLLMKLFYSRPSDVAFTTLRAKAIILEDKEGRDRIILSPEISTFPSRIRKDTLSGVLILDAQGNDRVIMGSSPTVNINGQIVKRSTDGPYGLAFNDEKGIEKGGVGYYTDKKLAALGLDGPSGEGIVLFVPERELFGQKAGIIINDPQNGGQLIYIGANTFGERIINLDVQGKGRFSIEMDSFSKTNLKFYNFQTNQQKVISSAN